MKNFKLAVVIPFHGKVTLNFSLHLAKLLSNTSVPTEVIVSRHYNIDKARQRGVDNAIDSGFTHILFIDSDIMPYTYKNNQFIPFYNAIDYMLSFNYPIVSGLYISKKDMRPAVYDYTNENIPFKPTDKKFEDFVNKISFVDGIGLGFCLIDTIVFDILEKSGYYPFFEYKTDYEKKIEISEDLDFCLKLKRCGFSIMLLGQICCMHIATMGLLPNGMIQYLSLSD